MTSLRYVTLVWPGLPWAWLRGSRAGLVLALAFAISVDLAVVTTFIWTDLVELPFIVAAWTAVAVVWLVSTVSAAAAFPPPLVRPAPARVDPLFIRARDAYLARDWIGAETRLRELLALSPTDGEAQLLLATLLRRVDRRAEAGRELDKLSASDTGIRWQAAIAAERRLLAGAQEPAATSDEPATLPLSPDAAADGDSASRAHAA